MEFWHQSWDFWEIVNKNSNPCLVDELNKNMGFEFESIEMFKDISHLDHIRLMYRVILKTMSQFS